MIAILTLSLEIIFMETLQPSQHPADPQNSVNEPKTSARRRRGKLVYRLMAYFQ